MSLDPERLRAVTQLMTGKALDADEATQLAGYLAVAEEVLPWLVLKRGALVHDAELAEALSAVAGSVSGATTPREPELISSQQKLQADSQVRSAMKRLIEDHVERASLARAVDAALHARNRFEVADVHFDYAHCIL